MDSQSFQRSNNSDLQLDGIGDERGGGIVHIRKIDEISSGSGFCSLRSRKILSGLAVPAHNRDPECNSEIDVGEGVSVSASSSIFIS